MTDAISRLGVVVEEKGIQDTLRGLDKLIVLMEKAENPEEYYINVIMQEKIKLYLEYVDNASFWYDIKLIFKTFLVILKDR